MKNAGFRESHVLVFVMLLISYITAVRVNGELVRLPTPLFLVFALFFTSFNYKNIIWVLLFSTFTALHAATLLIGGLNVIEPGSLIKDLILYLSQTIIYSLCFWRLNYDDNEEIVVKFFKLYLIISIIFWIGSSVTGVYVAVDNSYAIPRAQGFVTEPSNLAHFIPALIIYFWRSLNYKWVLVSAIVIFLAFSPTVYITLVFALFLVSFLTLSPKKIISIIAVVVTISALYINWEGVAPYIVSYGQIGEVVVRIVEGFIFIFEDGATGANSRASLVFDGVEFMSGNGLWWIGTGFGSSDAVAVKFNEGMLFDANNWSSFVLWFGFPGLAFLLFIHSVVLIELRKRALRSSLTFIDYLLATMIISNTVNGGGVWVQQVFFTLIAYRLLNSNLINSSNSRSITK